MNTQKCQTYQCNNQVVPGHDYCLSCLSRQNGHGSDGAAMTIPLLSTLNPYAIQLDGDEAPMLVLAELQSRLLRCKAELTRQRDRYQHQKGELLRALYANEQQDETIRQQAETIRRQDETIHRQQARLDGRMKTIRALKAQIREVFDAFQAEHNFAEGLRVQLEQVRLNLMQLPFDAGNGKGEWMQTDQDDVTPHERGFRVQYAKLDPDTFEVNTLFWYRAD